ncbi:hypothetical protein C8Q74DRAFT_1364706 [Fomes fomentarius]|nr:hypothetical protein C8Q74DRAFT_1364706 [Fomes fomentarius]
MVARSNSKVLTFFCLVVALGLATVSEANSLVHNSRDHVQLNRMIKKRAGDNLFSDFFGSPNNGGVVGAGADPTASLSSDTATSTSTSSTATGASTTPIDIFSSLFPPTTTASSSSTTSSVASSTTSSTESSTSSTSSSESSTSTSNYTGPDTDTQDPTRHTATRIVTATDSADPSATSGASTVGAAKDPNDNKVTKTTLTVIVAVAASIGGVALAWTLFRKWKLRPSSNFDERMQPIDWQPTGPEDSGIPGHRRAGSAASHGSFHSGEGHGYGSNHGHAGLEALPEHDFTAGASLAPVGGYADLQRGPSPQPSMSELSRGTSLNHQQQYGGAYDYNHGMRY